MYLSPFGRKSIRKSIMEIPGIMAKIVTDQIFSAVGGYFTTSDGFCHAVIATQERKVFEIFFNPQQGKGQSYLACFEMIVAADAFFTPDDNFNT